MSKPEKIKEIEPGTLTLACMGNEVSLILNFRSDYEALVFFEDIRERSQDGEPLTIHLHAKPFAPK